MRIGIYGGSFNPPHIGHAMVAAWLHWTDQVDEVWMVPTHHHAFGKPLMPFTLRCTLCEALGACVGPWVRVEPIEASLPSPSYTIDTLEALSDRHPRHSFRLVIGSDILPDTPRWKRWDRIQAQFSPLVVGRDGYADVEGRPTFPGVSSTQIRTLLRQGLSVDQLVPAAVLDKLPKGAFNL